MTLIISLCVVAIAVGFLLPRRLGALGFAVGAVALFTLQLLANLFFVGFAGTDLEENLAYFNGSLMSYIGYNAQISYRAFAAPLFVLAVTTVIRLQKAGRTATD